MRRILFSSILVITMSAWSSLGFALETDNGAGTFTMSVTGEAQGVSLTGQGGGSTLDVGLDVFNNNKASAGVAVNPLLSAIATDTASESNIVFTASSDVYGTIGATAKFLDITDTSFTVDFVGAVNATATSVGTGTLDFNSGTSNTTATNFTGDGIISLAPNTTVIGALTTNTADTGTLELASASELNGAVGGATGLKAIDVLGGNNSAGVSATISGAVDANTFNLLTNTLNIGGALTIPTNGVINTTVASSSVFGNIDPSGAINLGTGVVIDETLVGASSLIAGNSIIVGLAVPITIDTTLGATGALSLSSGSQTIGSLNGAAGSTINLAGNTLTIGTLGTTDTYAGVISGSGALVKDGTGTTTLSGANTYTATTTVNGGTLTAGIVTQAFGLGSAVTLTSPGILDLGGNNETIGSITGTGTVTNSGANATLTSGADNTSTTFSGLIENGSGTTALTKSGTGTLTLNSANTYTGGTVINAGTLQISNDSALSTGIVINNGTLAIGANNLALGNTYTQNSGSTLDLTANSSSNFGSITSTGHAAVVSAGSTVNVTVGDYIPNNAILTIINTGGTGVTGTAPSTVNALDSARVHFSSSISGNNLILTADHTTTGFASLSNNANARSVGRVLDNETNPSADMTNVLNTLEFSSNAQTTAALNTLGPIVDRGVLDAITSSLNNFIGSSLGRAHDVLATGVSSGDESKLNGLWAKQYGGYMDQGTREGVAGYNAWNTGTVVGVDHLFNDNFTLGASVGYAYGQVNSDVNNGNVDINSAEGTIYAGYQGEEHPFYVDAAGSFANNWYNGQQDIIVSNINRIADSNYEGQQSSVYLEGGYKFDLGNSLQFTPLTSLQWTHLAIDSYTESNAGALDSSVNRQSYDILESGLGASLAYPVRYGWGSFTPEVHAKWLYDFIDDNMAVTSSFTGGGASFTSMGAVQARNGANIGGKLTFDLKNDVSLIAGVDTELKDNFYSVYGSVALRVKF